MIAGASLFTDCGTLLFTDYNRTENIGVYLFPLQFATIYNGLSASA